MTLTHNLAHNIAHYEPKSGGVQPIKVLTLS